ncbi:HEPN domain-containing protein [Albimonas pacifica]|uniref:HEPN domain-containing protein n=1 Tax=Albimonas pacifica TaxID=1114924 RepID=UPI0011600CB9|nr:HEPN domain-containing protein [Albimonas pacifica]
MIDLMGFVEFEGRRLSSRLRIDGSIIELECIFEDVEQLINPLRRIDVAIFKGSHKLFALSDLIHRTTSGRPGLGAASIYVSTIAVEDYSPDGADIAVSESWIVRISSWHMISRSSGIERAFERDANNRRVGIWRFAQPLDWAVRTSDGRLSATTISNIVEGGIHANSLTLDIVDSIRVHFSDLVGFREAIKEVHKIRLFGSLLFGKALNLEFFAVEAKEDGEYRTQHQVFGIKQISEAGLPARPLIGAAQREIIPKYFENFFSIYEQISEAISIHFLVSQELGFDPSTRLQMLCQALESIHRNLVPTSSAPLDLATLDGILASHGYGGELREKLVNQARHAHEPNLRQRLKYYFAKFEHEIRIVWPDIRKKSTINEIVDARNYFAHRSPRIGRPGGARLWNNVELTKAIVQLALLDAIGVDTTGLGQRMATERFAKFAIDR